MAEALRELGKYRIVAELGSGGMGDVYLAIVAGPNGFSKLVVLKVLKSDLAENADFLAMFLDEARLAAQLNHPNIVQTNEVGVEGGTYFIAMEYLEGQTLFRIQNRFGFAGKVRLAHRLRVLADVLSGLHHAHEVADCDGKPLSLVHRDVSPHNVFVTYDGQNKLLDFGIAKHASATFKTETGIIKGKVGYMGPEQARGEELDRRADVFAVGVMLWESVAGGSLWGRLPSGVQVKRLMSGDIPSIRDAVPGVAAELELILAQALAPDCNDRYATAADFAAELDAYITSLGTEAASGRALGLLIANEFADERVALRARIDTARRGLRESSDPGTSDRPAAGRDAMPTLPAPELTPSPTRLTHVTDGGARRTVVTSTAAPPRHVTRFALVAVSVLGVVLIAALFRAALPGDAPTLARTAAGATSNAPAPPNPPPPKVDSPPPTTAESAPDRAPIVANSVVPTTSATSTSIPTLAPPRPRVAHPSRAVAASPSSSAQAPVLGQPQPPTSHRIDTESPYAR